MGLHQISCSFTFIKQISNAHFPAMFPLCRMRRWRYMIMSRFSLKHSGTSLNMTEQYDYGHQTCKMVAFFGPSRPGLWCFNSELKTLSNGTHIVSNVILFPLLFLLVLTVVTCPITQLIQNSHNLHKCYWHIFLCTREGKTYNQKLLLWTGFGLIHYWINNCNYSAEGKREILKSFLAKLCQLSNIMFGLPHTCWSVDGASDSIFMLSIKAQYFFCCIIVHRRTQDDSMVGYTILQT